MYAMSTMNISLPDEMKAFVESQVATGLYANVSDFVRDVIRHDQRKHDRLWQEIEIGLSSDDSDLSPNQVIERARDRAKSRAA
jgi:antitoxin ParD1/3/4